MAPHKILIVGGGFGGVYTALRLEKIHRRSLTPIEVTLVSRDNYFLMTPLLFEAGSGVLEPRHAVNPIRPLLKSTRFVQADVTRIDLAAKTVHARQTDNPPGAVLDLSFDQLVLAVGGVTNTSIVPGGDTAFLFKTLSDAIILRNHMIDCFEKADAQSDPAAREALLRTVVIGGGLVGVELVGELSDSLHSLTRAYPRINPAEVKLELVEAGKKIAPEMESALTDFAQKVLDKRGVVTHLDTRVKSIQAGSITLPDDRTLPTRTVVMTTGVTAGPLVAGLDLPRGKTGRLVTDGSMRIKDHPGLWAIGDCAAIPDPASQGMPYPQLAQHALREANTLADNLVASVNGREVTPFIYKNKGVMAALGHFNGVGRIYKFHIYGLFAWLAWRGYYLLQMPQLSRKLRIMADWTLNLFLKNDIAKLDVEKVT